MEHSRGYRGVCERRGGYLIGGLLAAISILPLGAYMLRNQQPLIEMNDAKVVSVSPRESYALVDDGKIIGQEIRIEGFDRKILFDNDEIYGKIEERAIVNIVMRSDFPYSPHMDGISVEASVKD